jgi:hypothetical protein
MKPVTSHVQLGLRYRCSMVSFPTTAVHVSAQDCPTSSSRLGRKHSKANIRSSESEWIVIVLIE